MRKFPFAVIVALVLFLGGCQTSQPRPNHSQDTAAQHGLATLRQIVNAGNYASLGFESEAEVRQATLGEPLQVYRVQLDALRAFTENTDPETLLVDIRRSLYPVKVGDRVATSIFVTGSREGWRASELGNAAVARLVSRYRHGAGDFVVHVPAMKSWFVADRVEGHAHARDGRPAHQAPGGRDPAGRRRLPAAQGGVRRLQRLAAVVRSRSSQPPS
jgi:hypothetical protein